ncbi:MAG TPA: MgtC/SapB family protein [Pseudomonadales bacterium]|nr:MgtC/SapB family protein [Pseudomonadales bacterium]
MDATTNALLDPAQGFLPLAVALACGLIIGFERGWRQGGYGARDSGSDAESSPAGIRTFALVALLGGIASRLDLHGEALLLPALVLAVGALLFASYRADTSGDRGLTTEIALLLTLALGALAGAGFMLIAAAAAVVAAMLLGFKEEIHTTVGRLQRSEVHASLQLLLIAVVVLPLLPDRGMGPFDGLNPRTLGVLVMLIAGIGFVGYFAVRLLGARAGLLLTALFGGLTSSTAVTLGFSRLARRAPRRSALLGAGIALACATVGPRLLLEVSAVNAALLPSLLPGLAALTLVPLAGALWIASRHGDGSDAEVDEALQLQNPLELRQALLFGLVLAAVFVVASSARTLLGDTGVYAVAVLSGIVDVDAIALAMSQQARTDLDGTVAARAILLAAISNTLVKATLAAVFGGLALARWAVPLLAVTVLATTAALLLI